MSEYAHSDHSKSLPALPIPTCADPTSPAVGSRPFPFYRSKSFHRPEWFSCDESAFARQAHPTIDGQTMHSDGAGSLPDLRPRFQELKDPPPDSVDDKTCKFFHWFGEPPYDHGIRPYHSNPIHKSLHPAPHSLPFHETIHPN